MDRIHLATLDDDTPHYLRDIPRRAQEEPVLLLERKPLEEAVKAAGGAASIAVPDLLKTYQIRLPIYIGVTGPQNAKEVFHWHNDQAEVYLVLAGEAEMLGKRRWDDDTWVRRTARAGDLLIVQPEVCHYFRWQSTTGLALVFKAPQRAGVGPYPAGKVVCHFCPNFKHGCRLPEEFSLPAAEVA